MQEAAHSSCLMGNSWGGFDISVLSYKEGITYWAGFWALEKNGVLNFTY